MAVEELQAQISLLASQINSQPEDIFELQIQLQQKISELRSTGQAVPDDLLEL